MGVKMNNAPVYFTIGQVQFNPILNLDTYVPAIQAKMRAMQFPDYKSETVQEITFPTTTMQMLPSVRNQTQYRFGDMDGWAGFLLEENKLSFYTTKYDVFESFLQCIERGMQILDEVIHLDFIERLSLRYLDAVQPIHENESLAKYLAPEVLGLSQKLTGTTLTQSLSETLTQSADGHLLSRIIIRHGQIGMPIELAGLANKLHPRFYASDGLHAIVDTDAFFERRESFSVSFISEKLTALHDQIKQSFLQTITNHAQTVWA